jgi:hypothetical protein
MLSSAMQERIVTVADRHWAEHVRKSAFFAKLVAGKEPGQTMAHYVDKNMGDLLKRTFVGNTRREADARGQVARKRSMGDIWIRSYGTRMYNPVNVKAGEQAKNGRPNVVSMQKLLDYIFEGWIDSYYLLIVKFRLGTPVEHKSYLIDLLDWLDFVAFNAGPGQIMLREKDFYSAYEGGHKPAQLPMSAKVEKLFSRFQDGVQRLLKSRKKRLARQRRQFDAFNAAGNFTVDQSSMQFVP